uniref:PACT_coil_coil domain-containing protein n=1 Tax=Trichuris muris TaxID=70415 RepID=A0A5S6QM66_TRIMR
MLSDATDDLFADHGCDLIEDSLVSSDSTDMNCRNEISPNSTELHGTLLKCLLAVRQMLDFESLCDWSKVLETANFLCIDSPDSFEQFCSDFAEYRLQLQRHCSKRIQRYHAKKQEYQIAFLGEDEIFDGEDSLVVWRDTLESITQRTKNVQLVPNGTDSLSNDFANSGKKHDAFSLLLSFRDCLIFQAWLLQERKEALRAVNTMVDYVTKGQNVDSVAKSLCTGMANVDERLAEMTERLLHLETELKLQKCFDCVANFKSWLGVSQSTNFKENCLLKGEVLSLSVLSADKCQQTENSCWEDELDEDWLLSQLQEYFKRNARANVTENKQENDVFLDLSALAHLKDLVSQRWTENEGRLLTQIEELDAQLKAKEKQCKDCEQKIAEIRDDFELQLRAQGRQLEAAKKFILEQTTEHEEERQEYASQIAILKSRLAEELSRGSIEIQKFNSESPASSTTIVEALREDLALARASEEKLNKKIAQLQWTIDTISGEVETLKEEKSSLTARIEEAASVESNLRTTVNDLRNEKWKLGQRNDELHCEKSLLSQQVHALMLEKSHLQSSVEEMKLQNGHNGEEERRRLSAELNSMKSKEREWTLREKDLKSELQICKENLLTKANLLNQLTDECHGDDDIDDVALLRRRLEDKRDEIDRLQTTLSQMQVHIVAVKDVQKAYEGQKSMNEILKQSLADKKAEIDNYKSKMEDLEQILDQNLKEKEKLSATILNLNQVVADKTDTIDQLSSQFDQWKQNAQAQYDDTCSKYIEELGQLRDCLQARLDMKDESNDIGGLWKVINAAGRHFILETFKASQTAAEFEERLGKGNWITAGFLLSTQYLCNPENNGKSLPLCVAEGGNSSQHTRSAESTSDDVGSPTCTGCSPTKTTKHMRGSWRLKMLKSEIQQLRDFNNRLMNNLAAANESRLRDQSRHDTEIRSIRDHNVHLNKLLANERNSVAELQLKMDVLVQELLECRAKCCETVEEFNKLSRQTEASVEHYDLLHKEAIRVISALHENYNEEVSINRKVQKERDLLFSEVQNLRQRNTDTLTGQYCRSVADSVHCKWLTREDTINILSPVSNLSSPEPTLTQPCHHCTFSTRGCLCRMERICSSLIDQKRYLLRQLAQFEDTERQLKTFLWLNGAYRVPVKNKPFSRFKSAVLVVFFLNRLRSSLSERSKKL